jgi:hypothetical protein
MATIAAMTRFRRRRMATIATMTHLRRRKIAMMRKAVIPVGRMHPLGHFQMEVMATMRQGLGTRENKDLTLTPTLLRHYPHPEKGEKETATWLGGEQQL